MYSLVLMTAMSTTPSTADFHGYFRDRLFGCSGTSASVASGCGGGCSCQGGLFSGERIRSLFSFNGCSGCSGYASCTGCSGVAYASCCGGLVSYACQGGAIDMGSPFATPMPVSYSLPMGCYGSPTSFPTAPSIPPTNLPTNGLTPYAQPSETREYTPQNQLPPPGGLAGSPNRGTVIVRLPADARLYAEGSALSLTGAERSFVTPELTPGREYTYTFRVEYERGGRTQTESRSVVVTPGKVSTLEFADAGPRTEAPKAMPETKPMSLVKDESSLARAVLMVKVPAGATLYVNDARQSGTEFRTPPLPAGKEFTYTMRIETTRNGYPEQISQKVTFRAGDSLTVDFTNQMALR